MLHSDLNALEDLLASHNIKNTNKQDFMDQGEILSEHKLKHTGEKPLWCMECNNRCSSDDELLVHIK